MSNTSDVEVDTLAGANNVFSKLKGAVKCNSEVACECDWHDDCRIDMNITDRIWTVIKFGM